MALAGAVGIGVGLWLGSSLPRREAAAPPPREESAAMATPDCPPAPLPQAMALGGRPESGLLSAAAPPSSASAPPPSTALPTADAEWRELESMNPDELVVRVQEDGRLAAAMAEQVLRGGVDPDVRQFLATTLAQAQPALLEQSAEALLRTPDSAARQQAIDWLKDLPDPPRALASAVRSAALTEADPNALASALEALRHTGGLSSTDPDDAVVQQLRQYTAHSDPRVRRESLASLVQADHTDAVEPILSRALTDPDPAVQIAAIGATVDAGIRSSEAKAKLFDVCDSPATDPLVRAEALGALGSFRLAPEEVARLAAFNQQ